MLYSIEEKAEMNHWRVILLAARYDYAYRATRGTECRGRSWGGVWVVGGRGIQVGVCIRTGNYHL